MKRSASSSAVTATSTLSETASKRTKTEGVKSDSRFTFTAEDLEEADEAPTREEDDDDEDGEVEVEEVEDDEEGDALAGPSITTSNPLPAHLLPSSKA